MDFETRAIHVGQEPDPTTGAVSVPIYQTSTYAQERVGQHKGYDYSRGANPTRTALQVCLASLEGAEHGAAFSSGLGAVTTIMHLVHPSEHVISVNDVLARVDEMHDRRNGAETRGESGAVLRTLERGEADLEGRPGRVRAAGVVVALVLPDSLLRVGGGLVDRDADRACGWVRLLPDVDRARLEIHIRILVTEAVAPDGRDSVRVCGLLSGEPACEAADRAGDADGSARRRPRLGEDSVHPQQPGLAVENRLDAPDQPVAAQDREDVVAVLALGLGDIHLEPVAEAPQRFGPLAVVDEPVERREKGDPIADGPVVRLGMSQQAPLLEPDTERAEALLREQALGLSDRHALGLGVPARGQVPDSLAVLATDDGNLATPVQGVEHLCHVPVPPPDLGPAVLVTPRSVLELAGEQWAVALELTKDVALEACVLLQELADPALPVVPRPVTVTAHARTDERQVLDRPDERVPLDELPLLPEQPVELGAVERAEAAPENEVLV